MDLLSCQFFEEATTFMRYIYLLNDAENKVKVDTRTKNKKGYEIRARKINYKVIIISSKVESSAYILKIMSKSS